LPHLRLRIRVCSEMTRKLIYNCIKQGLITTESPLLTNNKEYWQAKLDEAKLIREGKQKKEEERKEKNGNGAKEQKQISIPHPITTAIKDLYLAWFSREFIMNHTYHGPAKNRSQKLKLSEADKDIAYLLKSNYTFKIN